VILKAQNVGKNKRVAGRKLLVKLDHVRNKNEDKIRKRLVLNGRSYRGGRIYIVSPAF
jgi:hypothetical protein